MMAPAKHIPFLVTVLIGMVASDACAQAPSTEYGRVLEAALPLIEAEGAPLRIDPRTFDPTQYSPAGDVIPKEIVFEEPFLSRLGLPEGDLVFANRCGAWVMPPLAPPADSIAELRQRCEDSGTNDAIVVGVALKGMTEAGRQYLVRGIGAGYWYTWRVILSDSDAATVELTEKSLLAGE